MMKQLISRCRAAVVLSLSLGSIVLSAGSSAGEEPRRAEHVVVVVFDGLRPDSVTQQDMPNLFELAQQGTRFAHHHPVFVSSTEVNGAALATGGYPQRDGIMANIEYRPDIDPLKPVAMEDPAAVRKGDEISHGNYILMPTVAELLRRNGRTTAIAGTKPVALLLDRAKPSADDAKQRQTVVQGRASDELLKSAPEEIKPFPKRIDSTKKANANQDHWTTRFLVEKLWKEPVPTYSVLWLSEPDFAQHGAGPGSDVAKQALHSDDKNLGVVLKALDTAGVRDKTDVLVVSDHGFSTISRNIDLVSSLNDAGFDACKEFKAPPKDGQVLVVGLGGSATLYVVGHDIGVIRRLVQFLQKSDFAGVILTRQPTDGAFTFQQARIDAPTAPDILVSFQWTSDQNKSGVPGLVISQGNKLGPGQGIHASLSAFDMHNTLIAGGPDFHHGYVDDLPSGNADVAPTILWLLGYKDFAATMDGRVLTEALENGPPSLDHPRTHVLETAGGPGAPDWRQYLQITDFGRQRYFDQGNAGTKP